MPGRAGQPPCLVSVDDEQFDQGEGLSTVATAASCQFSNFSRRRRSAKLRNRRESTRAALAAQNQTGKTG